MHAKTLGELKKSKYQTQSIQEEIRKNLIIKIKKKEKIFDGIFGYDHSVLPDIERALLSGHNMLLLGLRGQAKTRIARLVTSLLDEYIPIVSGSEINDDPFHPVSKMAKELIQNLGDQTPIDWIHRSERYVEKLATPDVTVADLIGDLDPVKAASQRLDFSDEKAIHFGLIPRSNRSIFVINELPDLQTRIQVSLFNILEENDLQIRGFKIKLPLNLLFIFTANPEDYTQRGNIITPLKDRIQSQILTHYPESLEIARKITQQEISTSDVIKNSIFISNILMDIIDQIAFSARKSDLIDQKSGVSARLSIAALELLYSAVQRRMLQHSTQKGIARISDLLTIIPALTGKMELLLEGEQLGSYETALTIINDAVYQIAKNILPKIENKKKSTPSIYSHTTDWFNKGNILHLDSTLTDKEYSTSLELVPIASELYEHFSKREHIIVKELILHFISSSNSIQKEWLDQRISFKDSLASMLNDLNIQ